MYNPDMVRNIEPAVASPSSMINASQLDAAVARNNAEFVGGIIGAAGDVYETKKMMDERDVQASAIELSQEFLRSNMQEEEARDASALAGGVLQMGQEAGPPDPATMAVVNEYKNKATRLREASQGGMSNMEYVSRIDTLTKQAIAKYPGLADKIRNTIGQATGMPGADLWAAQRFVATRFSGQGGDDGAAKREQQLLDQQFKDMAGILGGTPKFYSDLYSQDRALFLRREEEFAEKSGYAAAKTQQETMFANLQIESDMQADQQLRPLVNGVFAASMALNSTNLRDKEMQTAFATAISAYTKGKGVIDPRDLQTQIQLYNARMRKNITDSYDATATLLRQKMANSNMTDAKRNQMELELTRLRDTAMSKYAAEDKDGTSFLTMATIFANDKYKTIEDKSKAYDLAIKLKTALFNSPLYDMYILGGESREKVKREQPEFHDQMVKLETAITQNFDVLQNSLNSGGEIVRAGEFLTAASTSPGPVEKPNLPAESQQAYTQALHAKAIAELRKEDPTGISVNFVSSAFSTDVLTGAGAREFSLRKGEIANQIAKLPEEMQGVIKEQVSNVSVRTLNDINNKKKEIENKYGVSIILGVNSVGQLMPVFTKADTDLGPVTSPRQLRTENTAARNERTAITEFMNEVQPRLLNLVNVRQILTGEAANAISTEYASVIQDGLAYQGFFSLEGKPVQQQGGEEPAATPTGENKRVGMREIRQFATENGVSVDDAMTQLEDAGYTVE
jgi:hypothetical protein